jgi:transcriptional regulator
MYIYQAFTVEDQDQLHQFMHTYPFVTLITQEDGVPWGTHVPVLLDAGKGPQGTLIGHFARANPQRQMLARGAHALAIFHGPHAYINPSWYDPPTHDETPTWDFAVVHARGQPRLFEDERRLYDLLVRTITQMESAQERPWTLQLSFEEARPQLQRIVGFEMEITRLEGAFKLSQTRSAEDRKQLYQHLRRRNAHQDRLLAELMKQQAQPIGDGRGLLT